MGDQKVKFVRGKNEKHIGRGNRIAVTGVVTEILRNEKGKPILHVEIDGSGNELVLTPEECEKVGG